MYNNVHTTLNGIWCLMELFKDIVLKFFLKIAINYKMHTDILQLNILKNVGKYLVAIL